MSALRSHGVEWQAVMVCPQTLLKRKPQSQQPHARIDRSAIDHPEVGGVKVESGFPNCLSSLQFRVEFYNAGLMTLAHVRSACEPKMQLEAKNFRDMDGYRASSCFC